MASTSALRIVPQDHPTEAPRVYSYTRFSTPEQAAGDSKRRQGDAALRWTERKNAERAGEGLPPVSFDERLRLADLGVSAFRGTNTASDRGLGGFLYACREGLIAPGSFLLVESLDRISRMTPRRVSRLLDDIVDAGVTIVTLSDGQEYDHERLDNDPTALLIALMVSWRAHEESKVKGQRVAAAWAEKRRQVRSGEAKLLTRRGPAWLRWDDGAECWQERAPHAETVRRVYRLALEGVGEHRTAAILNAEAVPVMGRAKHWQRSTIAKLLRNPAVIGTLVPGRMEFGSGRRLRLLEEPITGVYPAVIAEPDWLSVRAMKDGRAPAPRGRGAGALSNFLAGLARCPECGAAMTRVNKGAGAKGGRPKLVCTKAKAGAAPHPYVSVDLGSLQAMFEQGWQRLLAEVPAGGASSLDSDRRNLEAAISHTEDELEHLTEACRSAPSATLAARIRALDAQIVSLRQDRDRVEERIELADHGLVRARLDELHMALDACNEPFQVARINGTLRTLFEGVVVDYRTGWMNFHWRQGGQTGILYEWRDGSD